METAGVILDVYDDPQGDVLRSLFPDPGMLPPMVKQGSALTPEQRAALPDDAFALVMHDNGVVLRKYAMVDQANLVLSAIYLLDSMDRMPEEAVKVASARLVAGCYNAGIQPPPQLIAAAQEKLADLYPSSSLRDLTEPKKDGVPAGKSYADHFPDPELRAAAIELQDEIDELDLEEDELRLRKDELRNDAKRLEMEQVQRLRGTNGEKVASLWVSGTLRSLVNGADSGDTPCTSSDKPYAEYFTDPELQQRALVLQQRDDELSLQMDEQRLRQQELEVEAKRLEMTQVQHLQNAKQPQAPQTAAVAPQVDTTGQTAKPTAQIKKAASGDCLLVLGGQGYYPVRTYGEVEKAASYFGEFWTDLTIDQRREYCTKLAYKADEFGFLELPELVGKYASRQFDPMHRLYFQPRIDAMQADPSAVDMYERLAKTASALDPDVAASALFELDKLCGLDAHYDTGIPDPFISLFGLTKTADADLNDTWSWSNNLGDSILEDDLLRLVQSTVHRTVLADTFDDNFVSALIKNPTVVFDSLPEPSKMVLARLAQREA